MNLFIGIEKQKTKIINGLSFTFTFVLFCCEFSKNENKKSFKNFSFSFFHFISFKLYKFTNDLKCKSVVLFIIYKYHN
jgi:hypothetical protein